MAETYQSIIQDKQIKQYFTFLIVFSILCFTAGILLCTHLTRSAKTMLLSHDEAVVSSLIRHGIPEQIIAEAFTDTDSGNTQTGKDFLAKIGIKSSLESQFLPTLYRFAKNAKFLTLTTSLLLVLLLLSVSFLFMYRRQQLYLQAASTITDYIDGDYSRHLPQTEEGTVYQIFSLIDQLAAMLRSTNETEHKSKIFLRNTISDISHQLKIPLAALSMYQEIMENEPDQPAVIREFASKTGLALKRMEDLIQSMLKITRLDAGNIMFEKQTCFLQELIAHSISELVTRAKGEEKEIILEGPPTDAIVCDPSWTGEAVGNLVKNALDHTPSKSIVRISWDVTPLTARIRISDNGDGINPEDIHHIFKRFYRSRSSSDTPGIGLGLPLTKSIVEGQGGTISVQSTPHAGTTFTLLFPEGGLCQIPRRQDQSNLTEM